ncbi:MAG: ABC transporter ATP-binding protein [Pseudomonadota bacterium]
MIEFRNVWKTYTLKGNKTQIACGLNLTLKLGENVAIIGRNGAGKSTLLNMIAGTIKPDRGEVIRYGRTSWPMGFAGGFHPELTGRQNARFVARIYGVNTDELEAYVEEFSELSHFLDLPVRTYSSGMRARLAFGVSLAARFDCYLVDEITGVGDARFRKKCREAFQERVASSQVIMVSHSDETLRSFCDTAIWLEKGQIRYFDDLEQGLKAYNAVIAA